MPIFAPKSIHYETRRSIVVRSHWSDYIHVVGSLDEISDLL